MFYKKLSHCFLALVIVLVASSLASAQTQFIKYKKYLIPIGGTPNVVYIDDIGELVSGVTSPFTPDVNGIQDLAVVLGMAATGRINLLAIGVGIPGKRISATSARPVDVDIARDIVENSSQEGLIPVHSGNGLLDAIEALAADASPSNRLVIAVGGPWYDVKNLLDRDSTLANKIKVIGVTASNIDDNTHPLLPSANQAYIDVKSLMGNANVTEIDIRMNSLNEPTFLKAQSNGQPFDAAFMNGFYDDNMEPILGGILDSESRFLDGSEYKNEAISLNSSIGSHYLRFGDFVAVATAFRAWGCDLEFPQSDQSCVFGNVATALQAAEQ